MTDITTCRHNLSNSPEIEHVGHKSHDVHTQRSPVHLYVSASYFSVTCKDDARTADDVLLDGASKYHRVLLI